MTSRIRVKWDYKGASKDTLKWSRMTAMVEALAEAFSIGVPGVDPDDIVPVAIKDGSVRMDVQVPTEPDPYIAALTSGVLNGNAPKLSALARKLQATVRVKAIGRGWHRLKFEPKTSTPSHLRGTAIYVALVESVGGATPHVRLRMPNDEIFSAKVDEGLAIKIGAHLYRQIRATLDMIYDQSARRVVTRTLIGFEPFEPRIARVPETPARPPNDLEFKSVAELLAERRAANG